MLQLFLASDTNQDGLVTEHEALNNENKVNVWRWAHKIKEMPTSLLIRMRHDGITYKEYTDCVILLICLFGKNIR